MHRKKSPGLRHKGHLAQICVLHGSSSISQTDGHAIVVTVRACVRVCACAFESEFETLKLRAQTNPHREPGRMFATTTKIEFGWGDGVAGNWTVDSILLQSDRRCVYPVVPWFFWEWSVADWSVAGWLGVAWLTSEWLVYLLVLASSQLHMSVY